MITVTLGGVELEAKTFHWKWSAGIAPNATKVTTRKSNLPKIELGKPTKLVIKEDSRPEFTYTVIPTHAGGSVDPAYATLNLVDRRWKWPLKHVYRHYNMRRRISETQANTQPGQPVEKWALAGDVTYYSWSLKGETTRWTVLDIVKDLFAAVDPEAKLNVIGEIKEFVLEDFDIDDGGDVAIARLLHFLPCYTLRVEPDGETVSFYSETTESESSLLKITHVIVGQSHISMVDKHAVRPPYIDVYFTREQDLRFDYREPTGSYTFFEELTRLNNVMQLPDLQATFTGAKHPVFRGSYVNFEDYFTWVQANGTVTGVVDPNFKPFNAALFRRWIASNMEKPRTAWVTQGKPGFCDQVWELRFQKMIPTWRHLFQFSLQGRARIASWSPVRAGVVNPENGIRAPADVFCGYTAIPSGKGLIKQAQEYTRDWYVNAWAADLVGQQCAPYDVVVENAENGIFGIVPRLDPWGYLEQLLPGRLNFSSSHNPWLQAKLILETLGLSDTWNLSVVMACVAASPNSEAALYRVRISPEEAAKALGYPVGPCNGPPMSIRVPPAGGWWSAQFTWDDAYGEVIRQSFFPGATPGPLVPPVEALLVNRDLVQALALAAAAKAYSVLVDRNEGHTIVPFEPLFKPMGRLQHVIHGIDERGFASTMLVCPPYIAPPDFWAWLPDSVRRILMKQVQL